MVIVGPQEKPMPDLDIFVGTFMGKNMVLELPEPCRGVFTFKTIFKYLLETMFTQIVKHGLNWVEVRDLGPILWENDATPLIRIFRPVLDQNIPPQN